MKATLSSQLNPSPLHRWHSLSGTRGESTSPSHNKPSESPVLKRSYNLYNISHWRPFSNHAQKSSGLICAPITPDLATRLALPQMVTENADPKGTAYTITIDSSDASVTTGISAQDRTLTCRTLASPDATVDSFRRPGHIIPLQARPGGVRERKGHTEAAVDFCRLAGKAPVGVIAELVESGESVEGVAEIRGENGMMRRDGCLRFGKKWGIKVCTIEDLVEYLEKTEGVVNGRP